jgi:hypothetical protein
MSVNVSARMVEAIDVVLYHGSHTMLQIDARRLQSNSFQARTAIRAGAHRCAASGVSLSVHIARPN